MAGRVGSRSYQNVVSKLKDDSEGFKFKLRRKASWIQKAFNQHYSSNIEPIMLLITDIPLPVLTADDEDITIADYCQLEYLLEIENEKIQNLFLPSD